MFTITDPKETIAKLWGKQIVKENEKYRLMKYVIRVNCDGRELLHNVITGQLVVLEQPEIEVLGQLPISYSPSIKALVNDYYLVPQRFDEHKQVINLRMILHKFDIMEAIKHNQITDYIILPTTTCNARCYYCYEKGIYSFTMTDEIAADTVKFITDNSGPKKQVSIRWFGGEPTVASKRIDQICKGLSNNGVQYSSSITTNGYLFDKNMVDRAKALWNLNSAMICLDGTEKNHNEIKSFVNAQDNPYQRILNNVGLLLESGIRVELRMNFDVGNYRDFEQILNEAIVRYRNNRLLQVHAFPVKGKHPDKNGKILHGSDEWIENKIVELNDMAREAGLFYRNIDLPSLFYSTCSAGTPRSMVISPRGDLTRCTGSFEDDQIVGSVVNGVLRSDYYKSWTEFSDLPKCRDCPFFPSCIMIEKCPGKGSCFVKETFRQYEEVINSVTRYWINKKKAIV